MKRVGILHPGEMGVAVATAVKNSGHEVLWASEGRREASRKRAESIGMVDAGTLTSLCEQCEVIVSVCPPEFASVVAGDVARFSFAGLYIDANAVAPDHKKAIALNLEKTGIRLVDGGIVGTPPKSRAQTWLYLSGPAAAEAAGLFVGGPMETEVIGREVGKASALKMCFAGQTKGATALLCAVMAAAEKLGVGEELKRQWERYGPSRADLERVERSAPKAWRFVTEMVEIASTLESAGMPREFHDAAAKIYNALSGFKDETPKLEEVIHRLAEA